jgi:hypothetical protein
MYGKDKKAQSPLLTMDIINIYLNFMNAIAFSIKITVPNNKPVVPKNMKT